MNKFSACLVIAILLTRVCSVWSQVSISSFEPTSGPVGTLVEIIGSNFDELPGNNTVYFGPVRATVVEASATMLKVEVPPGPTYDVITVLSNGTLARSNARFLVSFPNNGTGLDENSFALPPVGLEVGYQGSITSADFDGDGKPDLLGMSIDDANFSVLRNTSAGPGSASFAAPVPFPVNFSPYELIPEDMDGDGKKDVIVIKLGSYLSVHRNISTGPGSIAFADMAEFLVPMHSSKAAVGDLDSDGKADIAVINLSSNSLSILRNTSTGPGSISFAPKIDLYPGNDKGRICIGDLDGDGKPDIGLASFYGGVLSILRNNGSGAGDISFFPIEDFNIGGSPTGLYFPDLDGDGKLDVVLNNWEEGNISIFRNVTGSPGPISFAEEQNFATGSHPSGISMADFDGDGRADLAVTNVASNTFSLLRNQSAPGSIVLAQKEDFSGLSQPYEIHAMDVDVDGKADIVWGNGSGPAIFRNATLSPPRIASVSSYSGHIGSQITITGGYFHPSLSSNVVFFGATRGEVTAASLSRLVVTVPSGATYAPISITVNGLTVYTSKPFVPTFPTGGIVDENSFDAKVDFDTDGFPNNPILGDLDRDGKADLIVTNAGHSTVNVHHNASTPGVISSGSFAARVDFNTVFVPSMAALGDLDGDGKLDLAMANGETGTVILFRNNSTPGSFGTESFDAPVYIAAGLAAYGIAIGDLDEDGRPDIIATTPGANVVTILRNVHTGGALNAESFETKVDFATRTEPRDVALCDVDGDGKRDLVVLNGQEAFVSVFRNNMGVAGTINSDSFAPRQDFATGPSPSGLAVGDLDQDGRIDLVVSALDDDGVSILKNTSVPLIVDENSFSSRVLIPTGSNPRNATVADVDGDGMLDIVAPNNFSEVSVYKNVSVPGTIDVNSFAEGIDLPGGQNTWSATVGDVDGDGKPELIIISVNSNAVSVYRNKITPGPPPTLDAFSPLRAEPGAAVTITGSNFNHITTNNTVTFNGVKANVTSCTATTITAVVPAGSTTGPLQVRVGLQTATGSRDFVIAPPPSITSFEPSSGRLGETLKIVGVAFDPEPSNNNVKIGNISATVLNGSSTELIVSIPDGAMTGKIAVTTDDITATSASDFTVIPGPVITSFDPLTGIEGSSITIFGTNFHTTAEKNVVKINGVTADVTQSDETSITATVPADVTSGKITVTIGTQTATSESDFIFIPKPLINSIEPLSGTAGALITITGANFDPTAENNTVKFNGVVATIVESSTTSISAKVPEGASTGPLTVTVGQQTVISSSDFVVIVDTTPPEVTDNSLTSVAPGNPITISAFIAEDLSQILSASVEYRSTSVGGSPTTVALSADGSTYSAQIPANAIGELGVEYRIRAASAGGEYVSPAYVSVQVINNTGVTIPYSSFGGEQSDYRIIAVPLSLSNNTVGDVFEELGTYDKTKWRMFRYNVGQTSELNITSPVLPGFGYWLIVKDDPGMNLQSGAGTTVEATTDEPFEIDLRADWNQIGNPYGFNIAWEDVQAENPGLPGLRVFHGEFTDGGILSRMEGGFVKVASPMKLRFPVIKNPAVQAGRMRNASREQHPIDGTNWRVYFTIEHNDVVNRISGFGMNKNASEGFDPYDGFNMPAFFEKTLQLSHDKKEGGDSYSADIVPPASEHEWTFEIASTAGEGPITIRWDNAYFGDGDSELWLWDESQQRAVDMRMENEYSFQKHSSSKFKVFYGGRSFIRERTALSNLVLHAAWPVPVEGQVTVSFSVPESKAPRNIGVSLIDVFGRTLVARESEFSPGYYELPIDRTREIRAGVYFIKISDGKTTATTRLVFK